MHEALLKSGAVTALTKNRFYRKIRQAIIATARKGLKLY